MTAVTSSRSLRSPAPAQSASIVLGGRRGFPAHSGRRRSGAPRRCLRTAPTSLVGGGLGVATCVYLAGVFLTADAARTDNTPLAERLRRRTLAVGVVTGAIVLAGLDPILHDAPTLSHGLLHTAYPLLVAAEVAGATTLILLYRRSYSAARACAVAAVAAVVGGWGVGQYPWMLVDQLTIEAAAGAPATLTALLVVVALAVVLVLPPLIWLLRLTQSARPADVVAA